jgi:hypothetical protein
MKTLNGLLLGRGTAHRAAYRLNANVTIDRWPVDIADLFSLNRPGPHRAYAIFPETTARSWRLTAQPHDGDLRDLAGYDG